MKTITFICDKCKQSKSEADIVAIDVSYKIVRQNHNYPQSASAKKDICKQCLDKLGLLHQLPEKDYSEPENRNLRTFEDKLVDILSDLGVMFEE